MKYFCCLILLVLCLPVAAQDSNIALSASYVRQGELGYYPSAVFKLQGDYRINRTLFRAFAGYGFEPKYFGDGSTIRYGGFIRQICTLPRVYQYPPEHPKEPYFEIGLAAVHQVTSQYTKNGISLKLGAGLNYRDGSYGYRHSFKDFVSPNHTSSDRLEWEQFYPAVWKRLGFKHVLGLEWVRFDQSGKRLTARTGDIGAGVYWKF